MAKEFNARLVRLEGKIAWTVFHIPYAAQEAYGTNGRVNVTVTLDGHVFRGTLLPSRNGHYLAFNQAMKTATGKAQGDEVHVRIEPDLAPRVVEIPDVMKSVFLENEAARLAFEALPDYIKRDEIGRVTGARTEETRNKRLDNLLQRLQKSPAD